ncbi:MAG: DUF433 domain-containing protein [Dehalococcoidia bacterium]
MTAPAPAAVDISTLLWIMPSPSGGRLCLAGSGVSVRRISGLYNEGLTPEQMIEEFPHLTLPAVYAAITYYLANRERMDAELIADEQEAERLFRYYEQHGEFPDFDKN